ncbi:MAG: 16S rRNA (uracil(1498)-N(3))-methyltransferase [Clostridia bacterium]|nr:16S rRNA (uracil(1498)-N(3))-methyltransferase [Clostridia bacterium]
MPKFFVSSQNIKKEEITIIGEDVNHIKNVLRKKQGDKINISNTDVLKDYLCEIEKIEEKVITCKIVEELEAKAESNIKVSIWQGIPKAEKMEWIIQKSVELGVYDITPIEMKRCVVKLEEKDKKKKLERWQKIAEVASKQCGRNRIPQIKEVISSKNICQLSSQYDIVLVADEKEKENKLRYELEKLKKIEKEELKIAILIGPEGGIEREEIERLKDEKIKTITLGNRILRTETVALNILSIIMYELEK